MDSVLEEELLLLHLLLRGRESGFGAHVLEHVVLAVGEFAEEAINAVVDVELGLLVGCITVPKVVVLHSVRVHSQIQLMHVSNEVRVGVGSCGLVPGHVSERVRVEDPLRVRADSMSHLCDRIPIVLVCLVMS